MMPIGLEHSLTKGALGLIFHRDAIATSPSASARTSIVHAGARTSSGTEEDVAAYEARWPIGTRERVWLDVIAYTGLRRGDAVRFGRQHVRNGIGRIKTAKTGMEVTLPILPVLAETLAAGPCGDLTFITGKRGNPLTKEAFGNLFQKACNAAGINDRSAHGLRKIAATRAADRGATEAQLEVIFGWTGGRMASLYTRSANRRRLAMEAMHKLAND